MTTAIAGAGQPDRPTPEMPNEVPAQPLRPDEKGVPQPAEPEIPQLPPEPDQPRQPDTTPVTTPPVSALAD